MKSIIITLSLVLAACAGGHGSSPAAKVSAPGITWPLATATKTSQLGSVSCSTLSTGGVKCYDGNNIYTLSGLGGSMLDDVLVGSTVACAMQEPAGPAADCANLTDPSCTAPATNNVLYCWNLSDYSTIGIDESATVGFTSPTYADGAKSITLNGSNEMCINETVYQTGAAFVQNSQVCGTAVNSLGYLQ